MRSSELLEKKVVIAPFNTEAIFLYHQLVHDGIEVIAFMDKDVSLHNSSYLGTMIIPYFHFGGENIVAVIANPGYIVRDTIIYEELIAVNYKENEIQKQAEIEFCCNIKQIKSDINLLELSKIKYCDWMQLIKKKMYKYTNHDGFSIECLNLDITTRCSLKCKGCCVFMNYFYPRDQKDANLEEMIQSFELLMQHVDFVDALIPIGGEPFLYRKMDKLLIHLATSKAIDRIGKVLLITNGTVLPNKSTLEILGTHRGLFQTYLSDYGEYSIKRLEFVSLLNQYGCCYKNHVHDTWYLTSRPITPPDDLSIDDVKLKCAKCNARVGGCLRIAGKKIYSCAFVSFAAACHLIPDDKRDYLNIGEDEISKRSLRKFEREIHPGMAYCGSPINKDKKTNILIPVGEQATAIENCVRYE